MNPFRMYERLKDQRTKKLARQKLRKEGFRLAYDRKGNSFKVPINSPYVK